MTDAEFADALFSLDELLPPKPGPVRPMCMYRHPARGPLARTEAFEAWVAEHGNFGSGVRSHAWEVGILARSQPTGRCQATVLRCDTREPRHGRSGLGEWPACDCTTTINAYLARGACTGCAWEGPDRMAENPAVEDAMDHAWPGWRTVPVVDRWPGTGTSKAARARSDRWVAVVVPLYPEGWLEAGGPIRTLRTPPGTRHTDAHGTPWGGYDMAVVAGTGGAA